MHLLTRWCRKGLVGLGLLSLVCGCGRNDVEQLHKVGHKTMSKLMVATGGSRSKFGSTYHSVRGSVSETSLDSRVAVRLAWERMLAESEIEVETVSPGVVRLTGQVREPVQRQRAQDLAQGTTGVHQVMNEIGVGK